MISIAGIYDFLKRNVKLRRLSLAAFIAILAVLVLGLRYSEDISDFIPLGTSDREALSVYQKISGADKLVVLFLNPGDVDYTVEAIDRYEELLSEADTAGWCSDFMATFDMSRIQEVTDFVYDNMPYFLLDADYERIDSLLSVPGYVRDRLVRDKEMLMFPTGGLVTENLSRDPLGLFAPVLSRLNKSDSQLNFEIYDCHLFTPDMSRAVATMTSPFGNSETECNSRLVKMLEDVADKTCADYPDISIHITGGPEIAVGNASRIKKDSITAILISIVLIVLLLIYSFRSFRNILLIFLSIGWGWLFAMGGMALFSDRISIIVIGLSSVVLGIAVNYPLHLIAHIPHQPDMRSAIKEIAAPLIVGNVTTVGAFMALVPLRSAALRDLGLFASLLLAGTILFVLLYLPHLVRTGGAPGKHAFLDRIAGFSPENHRIIVIAAVVVTIVLACFSPDVEFDSNIANINYMTGDQRSDMEYFQSLVSNGAKEEDTRSIYVLSKGASFEDALDDNRVQLGRIDSLAAAGFVRSHSGLSDFIVSKDEQRHRLDLWNQFVAAYGPGLRSETLRAAQQTGFSASAFDPFILAISEPYAGGPHDFNHFRPLADRIFSGNFTELGETGGAYIVDVIDVDKKDIPYVKSVIDSSFDVTGMNSALASSLSDNFNYIGWACSLIVFFFLWFSFGSFELALISFLPMAVSWLWILGIMALAGIKFNIVNIILATFIFGQGDDYTIFVTEGCQHEYAYGRPILASYKSSILQSAMIMFVGIGTLIVAKHPALRSLAQVTIIGMSSVVFMAYLLPPLIFKWLTLRKGQRRDYPLTLRLLLSGVPSDAKDRVLARYAYKGKSVFRTVKKNLRLAENDLSLYAKDGNAVTVVEKGYGETAIYLALCNPDIRITALFDDEDRKQIARISSENFVENIKIR